MIKVRPVATLGTYDIAPPGHGDQEVPSTRFRVPGAVEIEVEPTGEGALYTPVALKIVVLLIDNTTKAAPDPKLFRWVVRVGDWRYQVFTMQLTGNVYQGGLLSRDLVALRLPGLLSRALRPQVLLVSDDGGYTIDSQDPDERAIVAYVTAQLVNDNPTQAVAAELGINANAAGQRVFRLRRAGRLPASTTRRGKKKPCLDDPSPSVSSPPGAGRPARPVSTPPLSTSTRTRKRGASES